MSADTMHAIPLSLTTRTLYAELRELALAIGATENMGDTPGGVVRKTLKGSDYLYYQYRDLNGSTRQAYLGPDNSATRQLTEHLATRADTRAADTRHLHELRAAFVAAGGGIMEQAPLRVLGAFADAGALQPGLGAGVLVGTHAFNVIGNLLGVRWASQMQTQDIDLAGDVDIAVARPALPAQDILAQLEMGFIPVPTLDRGAAATSFRVRGKDIRVDLLTPLVGKPDSRPVFVPALNANAHPLRFLDYLLEFPVPALAIGRSTMALVNVPQPERFGLHKLLVSESRESVFAAKATKDRLQAMQLLEVLIAEAPDGLAAAKEDLVTRGKGWSDKLARALKKCDANYPAVVSYLNSLAI